MPVGSGAHRYAHVQGWPQLPAGITLGWIGSVGVDSQGPRLLLLSRHAPHGRI